MLDQGASRWTQVGGLRMHARAWGPPGGRVVVLVHGFVISSRYFTPTGRRLAELGHRVLAPDLPGFGRSQTPEAPLDVPGLAEALVAWMDAAGLRDAALVGNSMGCQTALEAAVRAPDRVRALVLEGPTADADARLPRQMLRLLADVPRESPLLWGKHVPDYLHYGLGRVPALARAMMAHRLLQRAPFVKCPTLIVRGAWDDIAPRPWCAQLARAIPHAALVEVPRAAHCAHYTRSRAFARAAAPFLARTA